MARSERRKRTGIQLCYPFEEKRLAKWAPPYFVQPKLDGVRCRAVWTPDGYALFSSTEEMILSVPHVNAALDKTSLMAELDGELYIHNQPFEEIYSRTSRTVELHPLYEEVTFAVFDVALEQISQLSRFTWLLNQKPLIDELEPVVSFVPTFMTQSIDEIMAYYVQFLNKGYEGIIVRHTDAPYVRRRSTFVMKFKPKKDDWYIVVGWKEEVDKFGVPKGTLGALVCCGDDGTEFSVGSGLTSDHRQDLWRDREKLVGNLCHVQYQHITPGKGVPRFPVFVSMDMPMEEL